VIERWRKRWGIDREAKKIPKEVEKNPERYSLLYLPHPVVVPGGRFQEVSLNKS
jgi:neutral trehalase